MKKILLLLLISLIAKPDYTSLGVGYGTTGDVDTIGIGYEQVGPKFAFVTAVGRAEAFGISSSVFSAGLDYAFTNFNEGSFYVGASYARSMVGDFTVSDTLLNLGYGKLSGEGLDYGLDIDSDGDLSVGATSWLEGGLGIGAGVAFLENDEALTLTLQYQW